MAAAASYGSSFLLWRPCLLWELLPLMVAGASCGGPAFHSSSCLCWQLLFARGAGPLAWDMMQLLPSFIQRVAACVATALAPPSSALGDRCAAVAQHPHCHHSLLSLIAIALLSLIAITHRNACDGWNLSSSPHLILHRTRC